MIAIITKIHLFPIKGMDPMSVQSATVTPAGALSWDRRLAFVDAHSGKFINGKNEPNIFRLRCGYNGTPTEVHFTVNSEAFTFSLLNDRDILRSFIEGYLKKDIRLIEKVDEGNPDDTVATGPTIVSRATLEAVQLWFPEISIDELFLRFRCNILIDGVPPFWEEQFSGGKKFVVGSVPFIGMYPCARCPVPPVNPLTGERTEGFQKKFAEMRRAVQPAYTDDRFYEHFYKITLNTKIQSPGFGKTVSVGETITPERDLSMEL